VIVFHKARLLATQSKVCTFSSQKERILLRSSISTVGKLGYSIGLISEHSYLVKTWKYCSFHHFTCPLSLSAFLTHWSKQKEKENKSHW